MHLLRLKHKFLTLQAGRGLAALLVVLNHAAAFVGKESGLWERHDIYSAFQGCALGVQFFFVLSGIVILSVHWNDVGRPAATGSFLWKRFSRVYPLYWIFLILTVVRHSAVSDNGLDYQRNPWVITSSVLLFHLFSTQSNVAVAWTLFNEVLFYGFFALIILNKKIGSILFLLWIAASVFFFAKTESYWFNIFSANHLLFALGMIAAWLLRRPQLPFARTSFYVGFVVFLAGVVLEGHILAGTLAVGLIAGLGAAFTLVGAAEMERRGAFPVPRWLAFLGDASYSIYLAHFMVVSTVARVCYRWHTLPVPIAAWMALFFVCGTSAGILVHLLIERPLMKKLRRASENAPKTAEAST